MAYRTVYNSHGLQDSVLYSRITGQCIILMAYRTVYNIQGLEDSV